MPPLIRLDYITPDHSAEILQLRSGVVTIGREPENGIVIDSEAVSRRHALISEAGMYWIFRDLGSTNGSWVNNLQIKSDRIRLLRDGDVIQVANFAMRVTELAKDKTETDAVIQLLIFFGEDYQGEVPLTNARTSCVIGGDGEIKIEGESRQLARISYSPGTSRVELTANSTDVAVMVNDLLVRGTTSLNDGDEVKVGGCRIVIADRHAVHQRGVVQNWSPVANKALAAQSAVVTPHVGMRPQDDWSTPIPKKANPRNFVFGQGGKDIDPLGTVTIPSQRTRPYSGYDTHPAARFSGNTFQGDDDDSASAGSERRLILFGIVTLVLIIAAVWVLLSVQV